MTKISASVKGGLSLIVSSSFFILLFGIKYTIFRRSHANSFNHQSNAIFSKNIP
jgi:hypothetical protein